MGGVYAIDNSYAIGLMLLSDVALAAAVFTWLRLGRPALASEPGVTAAAAPALPALERR
jgi:NNP family nitrate/nitrite transporter-like MFS transporter